MGRHPDRVRPGRLWAGGMGVPSGAEADLRSESGVRPRNPVPATIREGVVMFVNLLSSPGQGGKDQQFRDWFAWSNREYAAFDGFIRRRLLRPTAGGNYAALVEHQTYETRSWACIPVRHKPRHVDA